MNKITAPTDHDRVQANAKLEEPHPDTIPSIGFYRDDLDVGHCIVQFVIYRVRYLIVKE